MARKVPQEKGPVSGRIINERSFNALVRRLDVAAAKMAEAKGVMGNEVEQAVADHNVHKDALRIVRKYAKKAPASAAEFYLHLQTYWDYQKLGQPQDDLIETPDQRTGDGHEPGDAEIAAGTHHVDPTTGNVVPITSAA